MSRSLKHRIAKLEEQIGRKMSGALILVEAGVTKKQALKRHFRDYPDHRDSEFFIFLYFSKEETGEKKEGNHPKTSQNKKKTQTAQKDVVPGIGKILEEKPKNDSDKVNGASLEKDQQMEEELPWPMKMDRKMPFESWPGFFCQRGVWFDRVALMPIDPSAPIPLQPEKLDIRQRRTQITWKGEDCYLQNGWLFSRSTHEAIKI